MNCFITQLHSTDIPSGNCVYIQPLCSGEKNLRVKIPHFIQSFLYSRALGFFCCFGGQLLFWSCFCFATNHAIYANIYGGFFLRDHSP